MRLKILLFKWVSLFALFFFFDISISEAQFTPGETFGKNRVQYEKLEWSYITTPRFEIYYYGNNYDIARITAEFAEKDYKRVTRTIGYSPYNKIKILVYNSYADLRQSNIGINYEGYEIGGQTRFIKSEIEIAFTGNKSSFKDELSLSISDILIFEMLYGGTLKDLLKSSYLLNLPEWYMSGAASYVSKGWSEDMDNFVRDAFEHDRFKKIDHATGEEARILGHSVWNYIVEKYGKESISNILNLTRIVRGENASLLNSLGITAKQLETEWAAFYTKQKEAVNESYRDLTEVKKVQPPKKRWDLSQFAWSPDGQHIAYSVYQKGKKKVYVLDVASGSEQLVRTFGYKVLNQTFDTQLPLLAWRDNRILAIFGAEKGDHYIWFKDLGKKKQKKKPSIDFSRFNHILGFGFSDNGRVLTLSAERSGRSDIFTYDYRSRRIKRITNDEFDDIDPLFVPGTNNIVFASNRTTDSIDYKTRTGEYGEIGDHFQLYMFNPDSANKLIQLTNSIGKSVSPRAINDSTLLYLSDIRGITQLYRLNINTGVSIQVSDVNSGITKFSMHDGDLVFQAFENGEMSLFRIENFDYQSGTFTEKTPRQKIVDVRRLREFRKRKKEEEQERKREEARKKAQEEEQKRQAEKEEQLRKEKERLEAMMDSIKAKVPVDSIIPEFPTNANGQLPEEEASDEINTDAYRFDVFSKGKRKSFVERFKQKQLKNLKESYTVTRSAKYENRFAIDNLTTTMIADPLLGAGPVMDVQMTDVMENHKMNAGLFAAFGGGTNSFADNNSFYVEYLYLRKRIDYGFKFERVNFKPPVTFSTAQNYTLSTIRTSFALPFSVKSRVSFQPFFSFLTSSDLNFSVVDEVENYAGFNLEYVFDNTVVTGTNMMRGSRFKAVAVLNNSLSNSNNNFSSIKLDYRFYQPIYRGLVIASRVSTGSFVESSNKYFLLGGMDNWFYFEPDTPQYDNVNTPGGPFDFQDGQQFNSQWMYYEFVTSLRGFNFNKMYGKSYLLANIELRFPMLKFLSNKTIDSGFLRNLQFIGFYDVGSAWSGQSPFTVENSVNTEEIKSGGFTAKVINYRNPFLQGYGYGIRTTLLGYYLKYDVAWGIENNVTLPRTYYITLGYDF